jgi:RNA polymerase sigma-70 factor (ECF subfamily)
VALLREDAIVSMPPAVFLTGRPMIRTFLADDVLVDGRRIRMVPIAANRMPAFAIYSADATDTELRPYAVVLLDSDGSSIGRMSVFDDPRFVARFRLPESIAG